MKQLSRNKRAVYARKYYQKRKAKLAETGHTLAAPRVEVVKKNLQKLEAICLNMVDESMQRMSDPRWVMIPAEVFKNFRDTVLE